MAGPFIWAGNYAKSLKSLLNLNDDIYVLNGTVDPTVVAQDAPAGSIYVRRLVGSIATYLKEDNGLTTNWTIQGSAAAFNVNTILTSASGDVLVNASGNVLVSG